jgi:putative transposase
MVTSNHIHLLVYDNTGRDAIPKSIQLIAARTGQEIDFNMVRAGVVDHPQMWPFCGYNEIQNPPRRYRIIDIDRLTKLLGFTNLHDFQSAHKRWVEASLTVGKSERESEWTESIAVGGRSFVEKVKENLGFRAKDRTITGNKDQYQLREKVSDFDNTSIQGSESDAGQHVVMDNSFFWNYKS